MTNLNYPEQQTWFICWNDERTEIKSYSSVLKTQCMKTGWLEVDYYVNEHEWKQILDENNIELIESKSLLHDDSVG